MTGKFITIYGVNGTGKTVQTALLTQKLIREGIQAVKIKYPIYNLPPTGPRINAVLRKGFPMSDYDLQREFSQNRRDYEAVLKGEYLKNGIWVVAEDYIGTGIA